MAALGHSPTEAKMWQDWVVNDSIAGAGQHPSFPSTGSAGEEERKEHGNRGKVGRFRERRSFSGEDLR